MIDQPSEGPEESAVPDADESSDTAPETPSLLPKLPEGFTGHLVDGILPKDYAANLLPKGFAKQLGANFRASIDNAIAGERTGEMMRRVEAAGYLSKPSRGVIPMSLPPSPNVKVAQNTAAMAEDMEELVTIVAASLRVTEEMRDTTNTATDAAQRSGKHALIIAYVSTIASVGAVIVSVIALLASGKP